MKTKSVAAVLTAATMMGAGTAVAASGRVLVDTSPLHNRHWTTVYTNEVPLRWEWNAAATRAELDISGMSGTVTTNFAAAVSNWVWRAFVSEKPAAEDVYDLRLTFYNGHEVVVGVQTSRLAVVKGAFGEALIDPGPSDKKWTRVRENSAIPYDAEWTEATADASASRLVIIKTDGATQTNAFADAGGYFGWRLKHSDWGYGMFNLALTFPGSEGEWVATLKRVPEGFMFSVR